ncbi:Neuroblast differentiation-associated protein AHNAK [Liparis tanakae]|uniref:Neuroblast differentiation-associated protein AHNAK n=1 Tax=Liparis tanakae TaxID=230148 RepID=A0A4Z2IVM4_9TELE|nr:Neuroblast differentiation-associated protein AHNAK [Liparis tanakae]
MLKLASQENKNHSIGLKALALLEQSKMAEEEDTREVLFPDWEGTDKTGLTIEHSGGEIFVKEVKGESPAARTGQVYEGDQIVGATVYFDNMSSEETADLLKTLNRHKVGLKLQNKDKSPYCSPMSTPCRSPISTLTWEGKTRLGSSSPDIILSGEDEDYKRIYSKKIKPRLKSEDLAEGVDVRTERHSSTSTDGSTVTTITRRITTYTVDMPGGISEQLELSSPEFKGLRHESGDGSPRIQISQGNSSGKVGAEGVFESSNVSYTGPHVSSTKTGWGSGEVQVSTTSREVEGSRFQGPSFGVTEGKGQRGFEISRGSGEQGDRRIQMSGTSMTLRDSTNTGGEHITIGGLRGADVTSTGENGGSIGLSLPGKSLQIVTSSMDKTQAGSIDTSLGERTKMKVSETTISHPQAKGSDIRLGGPAIQVANVSKGYSLTPGNISMAGDDVNIEGSKLKGEVDFKAPEIHSSIQTKVPMSDIKYKMSEVTQSKVEGPEGGFEIPGIKIPSFGFTGPKIEAQDVDMKLTKPEIDFKAPEVDIKASKGKFESPDIDVQTPKVNIDLERAKGDFNHSKITMPSIGLKGQKREDDLDLSKPKIKGDITAPEVDMTCPQVDIETPKGGFEMPKIKMPTFKIKDPEMVGQDIDRNIGVKAPEVNIDVPGVGTKGLNAKVKGDKFNMPTITGPKTTMPNVDFNLKGPNLKGEVSAPKIEGDIKTVDVDIEVPEVNIGGPKSGFETPKMKMPSFNIKGQKGDGPERDFNTPKAKFDVKMPKVDINAPAIDVQGTDVPEFDIDVPTGGFEMPKIKMPSFGFKDPTDVDRNLPKGDIDVKVPNVNIKGSGLDVEGPDAKLKGPKIQLQSVSGPKQPEWDVSLKGPKIKGDFDVSAPKFKGDIKASKVDIGGQSVSKIKGDITTPEVDIKGTQLDSERHKIGFEMPKIKMPSFGLKSPHVEGPEVDINLPKADINTPDLDIKGPDFDIEGPSGKIREPKSNMPSISGTTLSMPNVDLQLKSDVDMSVPKIKGGIKTPEVDIQGPQVDIEGHKGGFEMPKIKIPSFGIKGSKLKGPEVDVNLPKGNIDVKVPDANIKVPDFDVEGPDVKLKGPKFQLTSGSGPKLPEWDVSLKGPKMKGDFNVSAPKIEGDIKAPKVEIEGPDVDIEGHKGGFKMPKFTMPSFGLKGQNIEGPDVDVSLPKADIDINAPDMDIKGPDFDIDSTSGKFRGPKFNMPSSAGAKLSMPHVDFNLKGPKMKGDVDMSVPKIKGGMKTPEVDIQGPQVDIEGHKGGFEMPKIKMPSFGFKGPQLEGPEVDVNLTKGNIDVKVPDVNIKGPDIDVEGPDVKLKGSKFQLPSISGPKLPEWDVSLKGPKMKGDFDVSAPKIEGPKLPEWDVSLKGPKMKGDFDVSASKIEGDIKAPKVDIERPDVDIEGHKGGFKMPKFNMPSFGLKGPKIEGPDIDVSLPKADIDINAPDLDIKGPDFDIESPSGPKLEGPDVDINLPKGNIDVKVPDVNIERPDFDVEGPDVKLKGTKFQLPSISVPKLPEWDVSLKGPKVKGDFDVSVPKIEGDIKAPKVDIGGPDVDIEGHKGGIKMPKFHMPSFGIKGPNIEGPDVDVSLPKADIDINAPGLDIRGPDFDIESPSVPAVVFITQKVP